MNKFFKDAAMKIYRIYAFFMLFSVFFLSFSDSYSIPAFARKYNMSCKTCHSPFPSLKQYGGEFAANGFVLSDQEAPRYFVNTGDEDLQLLRDLPIALKLEAYVTYNNEKSKRGDFNGPTIMKILSGGNISSLVSYYMYFIIERGEVVGLEDAFLMLNNVFIDNLDFYIGQFQVSDPLFKRELRLTLDDYLIYKFRPGLSNVDLTYDRGIMLTYDLPTSTGITLEVVNGNGIGSASNNNFDNDKYKNLMGRLSQDITDYLRIGGFGYYGKEEKNNNTNKLWMAGADFSLGFLSYFELNAQYVERRDDNAAFSHQGQDLKTRGAFTELLFKPSGDDSKWYSAMLLNWIESGQQEYNIKQGSLHLGFMLKRNIRFVTEYGYNFTSKFGMASAGFVTAF